MKWCILLNMPQFPVNKQSKIIVACMALHNFIRDSNINDVDFESNILDDSTHGTESSTGEGSSSGDDMDMGTLRDAIATAMVG